MKYLYRNVKTGEVVETTNQVSGGNWVPVEDANQIPTDEAHEEAEQEEIAEKPKARRGKK